VGRLDDRGYLLALRCDVCKSTATCTPPNLLSGWGPNSAHKHCECYNCNKMHSDAEVSAHSGVSHTCQMRRYHTVCVRTAGSLRRTAVCSNQNTLAMAGKRLQMTFKASNSVLKC